MSQYGAGSDGLLEPIKPWLSDPQVAEILVNRPQEIWVEKAGQLTRHEVVAFIPSHLERLFQLIANENEQRFSKTHPLLSASLQDGSRVQLCLPPTAKHHTLSIRRKVVRHFTLDDYQANAFYQQLRPTDIRDESLASLPATEKELIQLYHQNDWDGFIRRAIELRKNIVISGGTSTGKTTYLNACLRHIPANDRIIILEDTREVEIPHCNQVQLLASKGDQGEAKVNMQSLIQCCLRLRPDRIIMGEIRDESILDFVSACSTGHEGSITSIHANNPRLAFMRMVQLYKLNNVPSMTNEDILQELHEVIDIVLQVAKTGSGRLADGIHYKHSHLVNEL